MEYADDFLLPNNNPDKLQVFPYCLDNSERMLRMNFVSPERKQLRQQWIGPQLKHVLAGEQLNKLV